MKPAMSSPYQDYVKSTRTGGFFTIHPYPTKVNPTAIEEFLKTHTKPGDTVYDCFAGSCSLAAAVAELNVKQPGEPPRRAICNDLGFLPTWIARSIFSGASGKEFRTRALAALDDVEAKASWIYGAQKYAIWTDFLRCPSCCAEVSFLDHFVDQKRGAFRKAARCAECKAEVPSDSQRVTETVVDPFAGPKEAVKRRMVRVYDKASHGNAWGRPATHEDLQRVSEATAFIGRHPHLVPYVPLEGKWSEMHRTGYHTGISHLHHFYTPSNLAAMGLLYEAARRLPSPYDSLLMVAISSYNAAHSTLMTRFVFKRGATRPIVTSGQPGALYITHCPVEKNVFLGVRKKVETLARYLSVIESQAPNIAVARGPAQQVGLATNSVDYIFTDPPFGGNIQYAELAVISEGWLGTFTDAKLEAIISRSQGKGVNEYQALLTSCFAECYRVLKPGGAMTVVFHSTEKAVWRALNSALQDAGFQIGAATILDKTQGSFKQVTTAGAVSKDPVLLVYKPGGDAVRQPSVRQHSPPRGKKFAYSEYVAGRLAAGLVVDLDAEEFHDSD